MTSEALTLLQEKIGYTFKESDLLRAALTHASAGSERNYERLEFLGDRVLGLIMAQILFERFPQENEGDLAKRHAALVQGKMLAQIARDIDLGDPLILSESERAGGGSHNDNILADAMEALIGALYLDGGLDICAKLIRDLWAQNIDVMKEPPKDPKTALQEWAQSRALPLPDYSIVSRTGPDHAPEFEIGVTIEGYDQVTAKGFSRRIAEKEAARLFLEQRKQDK